MAHRAGSGVGQEVEKNIPAADVEKIVLGIPKHPLAVRPRCLANRLNAFNFEGFRNLQLRGVRRRLPIYKFVNAH